VRLCVFSDIHGNLEALNAVLAHARRMGVERYVCLGDIVGYGANPNECIEQIRALGDCPCLLGNHDAAVIGIATNMSGAARKAIAWTRDRLTTANLWYLKEMEDVMKWGDISFSHSNPYRPRNWYYVSEKTYISSSFARSSAKLLFLGHTHVPMAITRKNFFCIYLRSPDHATYVPVADTNRQLFNCGSVGQPRDGDPRSSYLIYDDVKRRVEFYRVEYDFVTAGEKIVMAGLPEAFAHRLASGV
jgi:predicted phosphodiesterase